MRLENKVAIVAGGGPGIGEAVVRCLAEEGAEVAVVDINKRKACRLAKDLGEMGHKAIGIGADCTDKGQCEKVVDTTLKTFGKLHILVNVVGGLGKVALSKDSLDFIQQTGEEWDEAWRLNVKSHVFMCQAVAPHFMRERYGKIVNFSSVTGSRPKPVRTAYAAAKAADLNFSKSLAAILAPYKINVNILCPGVVFTPGFHQASAAQQRKINPKKFEGVTDREFYERKMATRTGAFGEMQTPEDMGRAVVFLVSDEARSITGALMVVDGGITA